MKKLLIVLSIVATFIAATAFITINKTNTNPEPEMCRQVMGVNMSYSQSGSTYTVEVRNNNDYTVNVQLQAVGYRDGRKRVVWTDNMQLTKGESNCSGCKATRKFTNDAEDISINMDVYKCD
ncbi:MAG: hypothetical protein J5711_07380 [Bacteroidales bacterium]|nr:hypothetical protein [Bacteroidales bacterium]